jgi:hypothetical protein
MSWPCSTDGSTVARRQAALGTLAGLIDRQGASPETRASSARALLDAINDQRQVEGPDQLRRRVGALAHELVPRRRPELALFLGVLAELPAPPAGENQCMPRAIVGHELETYLSWLTAPDVDQPLRLALAYLLAHFPEHRQDVLDAAAVGDLDRDDLTRLERCLEASAPATSEGLGRVWPSPATWAQLDGSTEITWREVLALSPEDIATIYDVETQALLAYAGAKAAAACGLAP